MISFLTLNLVAFGQELPAPLFGSPTDEDLPMRRGVLGERALAGIFGLAAGMRCELASFEFIQDSPASTASGTLNVSAPVATKGVNFVLVKKNDWTGDVWADCNGNTCCGNNSPCPECDSWGLSSGGLPALVLDPSDTNTDGHLFPAQWANFGAAFEGTNMEEDVDVYWCYPPPLVFLETTTTDELKETVVGIMGFLAQASWETGAWVSCDEINHTGWAAASCSQKANDGTQLYQDEASGAHACALDPTMALTGGAPTEAEKLKCGPNYSNPDLTNCCWWGRGSIQTTGPGNYGEFQKLIVERSDLDFQDVDLCANPEKICAGDELKFIAGIYFWVTKVQSDSCYQNTLDKFLDGWKYNRVQRSVPGCKPWAYGIGGVVNMGHWNKHAHGESGRVGRLRTYMTTVRRAFRNYAGPATNPTHCTGNKAVDTIFDSIDLATLTGFTATKSTYKFSAFCAALREFLI